MNKFFQMTPPFLPLVMNKENKKKKMRKKRMKSNWNIPNKPSQIQKKKKGMI